MEGRSHVRGFYAGTARGGTTDRIGIVLVFPSAALPGRCGWPPDRAVEPPG
jgi:hypothetical protein